jgi:MFS transporter, FHS family, glucose/mannose:H+ symporter
MLNVKIKLSLFINFFVIGILLNSVGIVILQVIEDYHVTKEAASVLEAFKDLSIAVFSFLIASYIPKFGYKRSMLVALLTLILASLMMKLIGGFFMSKMMFAMIGFSFALIKVSAYSTVGIITSNADEHASLMSILEGVFMVGVLSGYWIFGFFIESTSSTWLDTYWLLGAMSLLAFIMLFTTKLDESQVKKEGFKTIHEFLDMIALVRFPLVLIFIISAFFYVLIEQSIQTWLPTFNRQILFLPSSISVQIVSILAGAIALGRITGGYFIKKFHWMPVITVCIIGAMLIVLMVVPLTSGYNQGDITSWSQVPLAAYLLPCIGLFLGPIYPSLNSSILSVLPKNKQSAMTGLIVIFSALGGTTGSLITGQIFGRFDGQIAFYFTLVPITLLLIALFSYGKKRKNFVFKEI